MTKSTPKIEVGQVRAYTDKLYRVLEVKEFTVRISWIGIDPLYNQYSEYPTSLISGDRVVSDLERELL